MRLTGPALAVFLILLVIPLSCAVTIPDGQSPGQVLVITQPSVNESVFAEMRDFYVFGVFPGKVDTPGDIRIELFRGDDTRGERVRLVESHVDPVNGTTPWSSIEMNYSEGLDWGNLMVPDLVREPGSLYDPSNKIVVTNDYYLGLILGGVTKDFDTTYRDREGNILKDLTAGNYTLRVTGLSGDLAGQVAEKTLTFGLTSTALSTDRPPVNLQNRFEYAWSHNLRVYRDWFPGFFQFSGYGNKGYSVPKRWNPNNGIEVVNDRPGTSLDKPAVAENMMILYNINERSTTYAVEIAAIMRYGLEDRENSTFLYYDIGEPWIAYYDRASEKPVNISGKLLRFRQGDRLVITRAEILPAGAANRENTFDPNNTTTPMMVDFDLSDGITVPHGGSFTLYGVTKPIRTTVTGTSTPYRFMLDNRIAGITYTVTDEQGNEVYRTNRAVNLSRLFTPGSVQRFNSRFEFGHVFGDFMSPGRYRVTLSGTDEKGLDVPGTQEVFPVTIVPPGSEPACTCGNIWAWSHDRLSILSTESAVRQSCAGFYPRFSGPAFSTFSRSGNSSTVKRIAIISMPDIHSAVGPHLNKNGSFSGGLAEAAPLIQSVRREYDGSLLLSSGDDMGNDENGMFYRMYHGVPEREAMSAMAFDAGTIGNHDFDERLATYKESLGSTKFPIISANIRFNDTDVQNKVSPSIIRDVGGVKIGIFGLSNPEEGEYTPVLDGISLDPDVTTVARKMVQDLRSQDADLIIALTHLGEKKDREIAESVDGIDLIVGGHDHIYYLDQVNRTGDKKTVMFDAGVYGDSVGVYSFEFKGNGMEQPLWKVIPVDGSLGRDRNISSVIEPYADTYEQWSGAPAGFLETGFDARQYDTISGQSEAGSFVTSAMKQYGEGADIAFCPTGSLNKNASASKGIVTNGELVQMIDHNNRLSWIRMPGRDILTVLETSASFLKPLPDTRPGVMTPVHPLFLQVSGVTMNVDPSQSAGQRVSNVKVITKNGPSDLDPDREYLVVVNTRIGQFDKRYELFQDEPAGTIRTTDVRILDTVMGYVVDKNPALNSALVAAATG